MKSFAAETFNFLLFTFDLSRYIKQQTKRDGDKQYVALYVHGGRRQEAKDHLGAGAARARLCPPLSRADCHRSDFDSVSIGDWPTDAIDLPRPDRPYPSQRRLSAPERACLRADPDPDHFELNRHRDPARQCADWRGCDLRPA